MTWHWELPKIRSTTFINSFPETNRSLCMTLLFHQTLLTNFHLLKPGSYPTFNGKDGKAAFATRRKTKRCRFLNNFLSLCCLGNPKKHTRLLLILVNPNQNTLRTTKILLSSSKSSFYIKTFKWMWRKFRAQFLTLLMCSIIITLGTLVFQVKLVEHIFALTSIWFYITFSSI